MFSNLIGKIKNIIHDIGKVNIILMIIFLILTSNILFLHKKTNFIFWLIYIITGIKLLFFLKRKILWKIRNRLILSALFFIAAPIIILGLFCFLLLFLILANQGVTMVNYSIEKRLNYIERNVDEYLQLNNEEKILERVNKYKKFYPNKLKLVISKKDKLKYKNIFQFPSNFNTEKISITNYKGHFKIDNQLYLGCLKTNKNLLVFIALKVDNDYLQTISAGLSYYKLFWKNNFNKNIKNSDKIFKDLYEEESFILPWLYTFKYLDFDTDKDIPSQRQGLYYMEININDFWANIMGVDKKSIGYNIKNAVYIISGISIFIIIISFIVGIKIIRVITEAIKKISQATKRLRNGDFSTRIRIKSKDELQYMAESFNDMSAGISRLLKEEREQQRLAGELKVARNIQLKLLPSNKFKSEEFELAAANIAATEVAGDYFEYYYKNQEICVLVADVSGHGASAAFYMAEMKGLINYLLEEDLSPKDIISKCHFSIKKSMDKSTFITINVAKINYSKKEITFARGGHTPGIIFRNKELISEELFPKGLAIGLPSFREDSIQEIKIKYQKGDILFLFSDGLNEIMNSQNEMFGIERIKQIIKENKELSATEIKEIILKKSIEFSKDSKNQDDLTFIILKAIK